MNYLQGFFGRVLPAWVADQRVCANPLCSHARKRASLFASGRGSIALNDAWCCCPACFRQFLESELGDQGRTRPTRIGHRIPLGLALLAQERISRHALREALALQRCSPLKPIGTCLQEIGAITENNLTTALAAQWGVPAFLQEWPPSYSSLLPQPLIEYYSMAPVHWNAAKRTLLLGFASVVNHLVVVAVERMLACSVEPCMVRSSAFKAALERPPNRYTEAVQFSGGSRAEEIAATVLRYVIQTGAGDVRFARTSEFTWVRLTEPPALDLLFSCGAAASN